MYNLSMDVAISELRANLSSWLDRVREGGEVTVTDRGVPVARLVAVGAADTLQRLTAEGLIARPATATRPVATGAARVHASGSVADLVTDQRR
jgi:prevent-host-death family protein